MNPTQDLAARWDYVRSIAYQVTGAAISMLKSAGFNESTGPAGRDFSLMPEYYERAHAFLASLAKPVQPALEVSAQTLEEVYHFTSLTTGAAAFGGEEGMQNRVGLAYFAMRIGEKWEILTGTPAEVHERSTKFLRSQAQLRDTQKAKVAKLDAPAAAWLRKALIEEAGGEDKVAAFAFGQVVRNRIRFKAKDVREAFHRKKDWPSDDAIGRAKRRFARQPGNVAAR